MAKTKLHDIEVCIEDDVFQIIPYKLEITYENGTPYFSADTSTEGQSTIFECKLSDKRNRELIGYVLDRENWDETRSYWDGFSEWNTTEYLTVGETPRKIAQWLKRLPEYELKIEAI